MTAFRGFLEKIDPVNMWVLRMAGGFGIICLAIIVLAVLGGKLGKAEETQQLVDNMRMCAKILNVALILCSISFILTAFDEKPVGISVAGVGLALYFLLPVGLNAVAGKSTGTIAIFVALKPGAMTLMGLGFTKYGIDLILWIIELPQRARQTASVGANKKIDSAQQRLAQDANMFSPCWKLPYCREVIRKQCPAFLARKTCWKFGRGCYCDEEMISRIIRGESLEVIKSPTKMSSTKAPCGRCYIYLEHQGHKFRMLSPLSIPITIVTCFLAWKPYQGIFRIVFNRFDSFWNALGISGDPHKFVPKALVTDEKNVADVTSMQPVDMMHVAEIMFGIIIGFLLLVYISKFIEWVVFKAKL